MSKSTISYIIEALRQKPTEAGEYRGNGRPPRLQRGGNPIQDSQNDTNYRRYVKMQSDMGESPVSYEEWMRK